MSIGYHAKQKFRLEIIFIHFTFVITNKANKLPLEINFIEGKFAGWIKKVAIEANALENYEWRLTNPEDVIGTIKDNLKAELYDNVWVPAVPKQNQAENMDTYTLTAEIGYLIRKNRHKDVLTLC